MPVIVLCPLSCFISEVEPDFMIHKYKLLGEEKHYFLTKAVSISSRPSQTCPFNGHLFIIYVLFV